MSQANAGGPPPGWWQASDGNWYPPETHPQYQPPAPPPGNATVIVHGGVIPPVPGQSGWAPAVGAAVDPAQQAWGQGPGAAQPAWGQAAPAAAQPAWGQAAPAAGQPAWGQPNPAAGGPAWGQPAPGAAPPQWGQPAGPAPQTGWGGPAVAVKPSGPPTKRRPFVLIAILGAIATAVGSFLPWAISTFDDVEITVNGVGGDNGGGDGIIALVLAGLGLVFLLLAYLKRPRVFAILAFLCAALAAAVAWFNVADVISNQDDLKALAELTGSNATIEVGYGLWILAAGSTVMTLFALIASLRKASAS